MEFAHAIPELRAGSKHILRSDVLYQVWHQPSVTASFDLTPPLIHCHGLVSQFGSEEEADVGGNIHGIEGGRPVDEGLRRVASAEVYKAVGEAEPISPAASGSSST